MKWKNTMLDAQNAPTLTNTQKYDFTYDGLNRLTSAAYSELNASNITVNAGNFSEGYGYDSNGNFATLSRQGNKVLSRTSPVYGLVDNLTYNYGSNSNQLSSVSDAIAAGVVSHELHFIPTTGTYTYDNNGNATYVPQRSVTVAYNYLNLPSTVTVGSQGTISYLYDASGAKLKKTVGSAISYYQGSVLKLNGTDIVLTGEGRAVKNGTWSYEYDLKDHLGNTRVSFSAGNGTALPKQYKDYYPFGLEMAQAYTTDGAPTKFLYNGKELQDEYGLGWYDYGARFYDPTIGRWHTPDPLVEDDYAWSPYNYVRNNPIVHNDPDGRFWNYVIGGAAGAIAEYAGQVVANSIRDGGFSVENLYQDIDLGDIALSAGEGALTSGGSVIKGLAKGAIVVGSEIARNTVDITSNGVNVNSAGNVVKNTAIGLVIGKLGDAAPAPKAKIINAPTPKQAVNQARKEAAAAGTVVNREKRVAIENSAKNKQAKANGANEAAAKAAQNSAASGASETTKKTTDDKNKQ